MRTFEALLDHQNSEIKLTSLQIEPRSPENMLIKSGSSDLLDRTLALFLALDEVHVQGK